MTAHASFWKERLNVPAYSVRDAARYASTTSKTIGNWQKLRGNAISVIASREPRVALSYMQLIEVGVVAAMREAGVKLNTIRDARNYLASKFGSQFPFAEYRFKTSGKNLIVDSEALDPKDKDKLVVVSESGQYAFREILQRLLREFEYSAEDKGTVIQWKVAGADEPIVIDPRVAFGSPNVKGIATWVLKERYENGDSVADIADDFDLSKEMVLSGLKFERTNIDLDRPSRWLH